MVAKLAILAYNTIGSFCKLGARLVEKCLAGVFALALRDALEPSVANTVLELSNSLFSRLSLNKAIRRRASVIFRLSRPLQYKA